MPATSAASLPAASMWTTSPSRSSAAFARAASVSSSETTSRRAVAALGAAPPSRPTISGRRIIDGHRCAAGCGGSQAEVTRVLGGPGFGRRLRDGVVRALLGEEVARVAEQDLLDLLVGHAALVERRDQPALDVRVLPVRRDGIGLRVREPIAEA